MRTAELLLLASISFTLWTLMGATLRALHYKGDLRAREWRQTLLVSGGAQLSVLLWRLTRLIGPSAMRITSKLVTFGGIFFLVDYLIETAGL